MDGKAEYAEELKFWRNALHDECLLQKLDEFNGRAERFFGPEAVTRRNILELGMIIGAREILAQEPGDTVSDTIDIVDEDLRSELRKLPPEQLKLANEFLSVKVQEEILREVARRIAGIKNFTPGGKDSES